MKRQSKKRTISAVIVLAIIFALCAWTFGWGRGDINMMKFTANDVDRVELYSTDVRVGLHNAVVTEKADIQALIDSANSFQHTGSAIKELFKYGIGAGGTVMYEFDVYLTNGDTFPLHFGSNKDGQDRSDMEVTYWVYHPDRPAAPLLDTWTCRGSMDLFYEMYEKYDTTK